MSEKHEEKSNYISEPVVTFASSKDEVWHGFWFLNLALSKEGFIDAAHPALNIGQTSGPLNFRAIGKKYFSNIPAHPQVYFPDEIVHGYWQGAQRGLQLYIQPEAIERLVHQPFRIDDFNRINGADPIITHLLGALKIDVHRGHTDGSLLGETILAAMISHLLRDRLHYYSNLKFDLSENQFSNLKSWIEENLSSSISLKDMSSHFSISIRHLSRIFQARTGCSPYAYVLHRRVERAKEMALDGKLSLLEIAEAVGFANHAHMTDTFRKLVGVPPSHFCNKRTILPDSDDGIGQIKEIGRK